MLTAGGESAWPGGTSRCPYGWPLPLRVVQGQMSRLDRVLRAADRFQQRQRWLAFGLAAWKKFGDDQAGNLAALIAFYAFVAIFPLLLVLVTVLKLVLRHDPALRERLVSSALANYPVIGDQLKQSVTVLDQTGAAVVIGLIFVFVGARGGAGAAQNALNGGWEVPFSARPGFPWALLRSVSLIVVVGIGQIVTVTLSGIAGGAGHLISGVGAHIATVAVSLLLNIGLFWIGFRLATAPSVAMRDLRLGAPLPRPASPGLRFAGGGPGSPPAGRGAWGGGGGGGTRPGGGGGESGRGARGGSGGRQIAPADRLVIGVARPGSRPEETRCRYSGTGLPRTRPHGNRRLRTAGWRRRPAPIRPGCSRPTCRGPSPACWARPGPIRWASAAGHRSPTAA